MICITGHNIYTGLGFGSADVYSRVRRGETALERHCGEFGLTEPFYSSLFDRDEIDRRFCGRPGEGLTHLEKAMILSAEDAVAMSGVNPSAGDTMFFISSTKGNVELLEEDPTGNDGRICIWRSASKVASYFSNPNTPVCVTNACTSGICAQIAAMRAIRAGQCRNAVVIGADVLSKFIVAGFQSLKALSPERCRPFDAGRCGLNLSEAVATVVLSCDSVGMGVELENGCIRNDANHISAPSRTADGQISAIGGVLDGIDLTDLAFVNVHGTATLYNDSMESVALNHFAMDKVPAVSYKSLLGHTLGAAGVIETVISSLALLEGVVFPTWGYEQNGVPFAMSLSSGFRESHGGRFLKIMSGFGGINAATLYRKVK